MFFEKGENFRASTSPKFLLIDIDGTRVDHNRLWRRQGGSADVGSLRLRCRHGKRDDDVTGDVGKDGLYQAFDYLKLI